MRVVAALSLVAIFGCASTSRGSSPIEGTADEGVEGASGVDAREDTAPGIDTQLPPFDTSSCSEAGSTREPIHHRAIATTCPRTGITASCADTGSCGGPLWSACDAGACVYDQCVTDNECGATGVCSCIGETRGFGGMSLGNVCVPSDCRTDADCCPGEWCSPSDDDGSFYGASSYHCHTARDECVDDADCVTDAVVMICGFDSVVGHWTCRDEGGAG